MGEASSYAHRRTEDGQGEAGSAGSAPRGEARGPERGDFAWAPGEAGRASLLPIRHPDIWALYKKMEALHWVAQEVDLTRDRADWTRRMSSDERHFVRLQLAFFATIDNDVLRNLDTNLGPAADCMEAQAAYTVQKQQEWVHVEAYGLQIEAVMEGAEREEVLNAARTLPVVGRLRAWALRWFGGGVGTGPRLVAAAAVEGVLFSASFSALQWLREKNLLPGITEANTFIVRDEGVHTDLSCLLVRAHLRERPAQGVAAAIFEGVVGALDAFVAESLPVELIGMNAALMRQYVRHRADAVLAAMGYAPAFGAPVSPFRFMDKLALNDVAKVNFFESRPSQYQGVTRPGQSALGLDETPVED